jgi:predicted ATPase with chaperone activity
MRIGSTLGFGHRRFGRCDALTDILNGVLGVFFVFERQGSIGWEFRLDHRIEDRSVQVEVDISPGALPRTTLVGLAEAAVKESIHRIERALVNSGYARPSDHIVINLSPADLPKDAASLDLPIALGLLVADGQIQEESGRRTVYVGELALDGSLRAVRGTLSMASRTSSRTSPSARNSSNILRLKPWCR